MYYSLHTTETAEHHTGDVKYGRTQKRQTWDENYTIVGRKSSSNRGKVIALYKKIGGKGETIGKISEVRERRISEINVSMVVVQETMCHAPSLFIKLKCKLSA